MNDFVSLIVPAYKQEATIKVDLENIYRVLKETRWDFEIICVVDGFLDNTFNEANKVNLPNVIITGYPTNRGKGYAIRYGMARSKGNIIAFIDSGMDINANGISMLLEHMQWYNADIVVGSKRHPVSKVHYPLLRRIYSWGYHMGTKLLFRLKIRDTQTGLKVYRREVLEKVLPRLMVKTHAFDIELLAVSAYLGYNKIYEAPVDVKWDFKNTSFTKFLIFDPFIRGMLLDTLAVFYRLYFLHFYDDNNKRKWVYDEELQMKINTGESQ